jgi:hypothetical protein
MTSETRSALRRMVTAMMISALAVAVTGCSGGSSRANSSSATHVSAAARHARANIIALCEAPAESLRAAARNATTLEGDVTTLIVEAKRLHNMEIAQVVDRALRTGKPGEECAPRLAARIDIAALPQTPRQKFSAVGLSGFRRGANGFYAAHFGSGENAAQQECITSSGGMAENVEALENFLYLLDVGNPHARLLLGQLRADCMHEEA